MNKRNSVSRLPAGLRCELCKWRHLGCDGKRACGTCVSSGHAADCATSQSRPPPPRSGLSDAARSDLPQAQTPQSGTHEEGSRVDQLIIEAEKDLQQTFDEVWRMYDERNAECVVLREKLRELQERYDGMVRAMEGRWEVGVW